MKTLLISTFLFFLCISVQAQKTYKSTKHGIAFSSYEDFDTYELNDYDSRLNGPGYENDNYAVDIEVFPLAAIPQKHTDNLSNYAKTTSKQLDYIFVKDGSNVPKISSSHYVQSYDDEDNAIVYVIVILNTKKELAYEITVYSYNNKEAIAKGIVESFVLLE